MEYFTLENTILLGVVLVVASYVVYRVIDFLKIKVDKHFFYGIFPWLILSVFVRVYEDAGIYPNTFFTKTPGIEILFVAIVLPVFFLAKYIEKKKGFAYWKTLAIAGTIPVLFHLPFIQVVNPKGAGLIFIFFAIAVGIIGAIRRFVKFDMLSMWAISSHMLDASATFVSLTFFGYYEQHIVPNVFIDIAGGAWIMYVLKIAVLVPVIYVINKYTEDKNLRNFLLIVITVLGLAPGLRDTFRLFMGV
jgi:uncharacterized membrane protein